jgi:rod shape determining protein RodA
MDIAINVEERTLLKRLDWNLILVIFALNIIGLVNLFSATHGPDSTHVESLFINQLLWLGVGWFLFFAMTFLDYAIIYRLCIGVFVINVGFLLVVTFFGDVALGAQRWINFGFFKYQPSETMKLAMILLMARVLSNRSTHGRGMGFRELFVPLLSLLIPVALVVKQPDLGTAMMLVSISGSMILFAKVRKSILVTAVMLVVIAVPIAWKFVLHDYQKNRIFVFMSPNNDPRGTGYNSIQSKIAVGSGQFFGKGFRRGTQSQLEFLPERHTDFIFSVLSEEHGFVGSVAAIGLFCILFYIGLRVATHSRDKFGALVTIGVMCYVFWHMFVNIGMVIGLLPIVGIPLPLLSYGGSSMLTTMVGLGLVSSVSFRRYLF